MNDIVVVIPARLDSKRLAKKLLLKLDNQPIIRHVYNRCCQAKKIRDIYIATDNDKIIKECLNFTKNIIKTSSDHQSGTSRISEAIKNIECKFVINVQADECFIDPNLIDLIAKNIHKTKTMITSAFISRDQKLINSTSTIKLVVSHNNQAIYFSRSPIPFYQTSASGEYLIHHGIYGYTKSFLLKYNQLKQGVLEKKESLEQLRLIENNYPIDVILFNHPRLLAVDTLDDYLRAKATILKAI